MHKVTLTVKYIYYWVRGKYRLAMNAFDKQRKNFAIQCEDCNEVFDILPLANMHSTNKGHKIKVTEFWVTGKDRRS